MGRALDRFISFDATTGELCCESGVLLGEILQLTVPKGWFLPVTPGSQFVTVGGAIANDVHGKNHHRAGCFGNHLLELELLRSSGDRLQLKPNDPLFTATVAGLGLTGLITWARMQLIPVRSNQMSVESIRFEGLDGFFELSRESDASHDYTVAWVDCLASRGRGIFFRANHAVAGVGSEEGPYVTLTRPMRTKPHRAEPLRTKRRSMPFTPPVSLVNGLSLRAFNALYFHWPRKRHETQHFDPFFYPLDSIAHWNRMYGPAGFYQYQFVVGLRDGAAAISEALAEISRAGLGSFLAVLKVFGDRPSPGLMSFPQPGYCLALDFPRQPQLMALFQRLDRIILNAQGRLYPAKDACMSPQMFQQGYPRWQAFAQHIDPKFSSAFWRRVTG